MPQNTTYNNITEKQYNAHRYRQIRVKWKHTEQEHFGPFQDLNKLKIHLGSSSILYKTGAVDSKFWPRSLLMILDYDWLLELYSCL